MRNQIHVLIDLEEGQGTVSLLRDTARRDVFVGNGSSEYWSLLAAIQRILQLEVAQWRTRGTPESDR